MKHSFVPVHRLNEFTKQVPHRQLATKAALISPDIKTEEAFSQMKLIKTRLRNYLSDSSLSNLMKRAIESPNILSEDDLDAIIDIWNRKGRRIAV